MMFVWFKSEVFQLLFKGLVMSLIVDAKGVKHVVHSDQLVDYHQDFEVVLNGHTGRMEVVPYFWHVCQLRDHFDLVTGTMSYENALVLAHGFNVIQQRCAG